jgi:glycosyltransferase involved in cell wall biosynthesis
MLRAVFIDAEPVSSTGGGIRTCLLKTMDLLRSEGVHTLVYSHNPQVYCLAGHEARPLQRTAWPSGWARPLRRYAYQGLHDQVVAFGISAWLAEALIQDDTPMSHYEFCDYEGYAYHALQSAQLRPRIALRLHTPRYMVNTALPGPRLSSLALKWRERQCLKRTERVLAPSPHFAETYFPELHTQTLYNVPPEIPPATNRVPQDVLTPDFVFVGRWEPRKGLHVLLDAFSQFRLGAMDATHARLRIVGDAVDSGYARAVESLASYRQGLQQGWLSVEPGYSGPKAGLYAASRILLVPSLWENTPYVFSEAMAQGLIVMGSRTGDMIATQESTHGLAPEPGSVSSWCEALKALWQRRDESPLWLLKQDQWLQRRRLESIRQTLQHWREWHAPDPGVVS